MTGDNSFSLPLNGVRLSRVPSSENSSLWELCTTGIMSGSLLQLISQIPTVPQSADQSYPNSSTVSWSVRSQQLHSQLFSQISTVLQSADQSDSNSSTVSWSARSRSQYCSSTVSWSVRSQQLHSQLISQIPSYTVSWSVRSQQLPSQLFNQISTVLQSMDQSDPNSYTVS